MLVTDTKACPRMLASSVKKSLAPVQVLWKGVSGLVERGDGSNQGGPT